VSAGIAFLIGSFRRGGAERDLLELLRRLDRSRYEMHVLYLEEEGDMLEDFRRTGVAMRPLPIRNLASWSGLRAVADARRYARSRSIRLIQGFGVYGSLYAAAIRTGVPGARFVSYEFTSLKRSGWKARLFQPWYYRRADAIVVNSDAVMRAVREQGGAGSLPLVKIYNGFDPRRFEDLAGRPGDRPEGLPPGAPLVGAVGRLHPIKGHRYLVQAWPAVLSRFPDARLLLVGPSSEEQRSVIERAARDAGCRESIHLLGLREDVPQLLSAMDVVALPSLAEGFSNVVLEAGAAGRAVVATDVGGNGEAIVPGETGLIVPPADPESMARAIVELLENPDRRRAMGEAARKRVNSLFTVDRMIEGYDNLYRSLLAQGDRS